VILDTQFLGQLTERDERATQRAAEIDAEGLPRRVPTAVVSEIYYGIGRVDSEEHSVTLQRSYRRLFQSLSILGLDEDTARRAGVLRGRHAVSDDRSNLDGADSVVAAHGLALDEPVVSNDGDFEDVDGLAVSRY
jgi:predicted nucleic acid-binding protein